VLVFGKSPATHRVTNSSVGEGEVLVIPMLGKKVPG
jgi:hypothetical protein